MSTMKFLNCEKKRIQYSGNLLEKGGYHEF